MKDSHDQLIALQERKLQSQEDGAQDWELEATEVARVEQAGTAKCEGNEDSLIVSKCGIGWLRNFITKAINTRICPGFSFMCAQMCYKGTSEEFKVPTMELWLNISEP